ncbi:MAG: biotin--[acetyl-CoA-carboxylase] ligase [Syntrophomonadaceae bacterium]|nr:biotin--[acetyl-CoA-carboxylase] ligase [Syntrophomonadaceae bacterium]
MDLLSPENVCPGLISKYFGQKYYYYQELDSTNLKAQELAAGGVPEGTAVVAEMQTAGRGRRGRSWHSPEGQGIYVTVVLRPALPLHEVSRVSQVAAVAVAETLQEELQLPARIKWPNDILINGRKIAGILSEAAIKQNHILYVVTGIGLNINNRLEDFPDDLRTAPTSAREENKMFVPRVLLLQGLLNRFEKCYQQLLEGNFSDILLRGRKLSQDIGQRVKFDTPAGYEIGLAIDLDEDGSLLVKDDAGIIHTVISGEINIIDK